MAAGTTGTLLADRYRVLRRLGTGGMASVFLAEDERLGRKVAVKRLHSESAEDMARRFVREAKVGASLNHPNIVSVYDTVTDDDAVLLVMEYVEGETLRDAIARGPLAPEQALRLMRGVASALDHAHEHGVVHRDVKPANILIGRDGRAKLADLGIASVAERTRITRSGTVLGTAPYLAPERLEGGQGGPAADIYALAAVAYEALSGHKAMEGATPIEIARRIVSSQPADITEHWPEAPPQAAEVLRRGLAKQPEERPATAGALVDELGRSLDPLFEARTRPTTPLNESRAATAAEPPPRLPVPPPGPGRPHGGRPRWLVPVLALAALAILLVVLLSAGGGGDGNKSSSQKSPAAAKKKTSTSKSSAPAAGGGSTQSTPAGDPGKTVSDFYTSSIGGNIDHAWSISTENLHNQVGGRSSLQHQEASLNSIRFTRLDTTSKTANSATVAFADQAIHETFTDDCTGTANLVPGGPNGWLLDHIAVNCARAGGSAAPAGPPGQAKKQAKGPKGKGGD